MPVPPLRRLDEQLCLRGVAQDEARRQRDLHAAGAEDASEVVGIGISVIDWKQKTRKNPRPPRRWNPRRIAMTYWTNIRKIVYRAPQLEKVTYTKLYSFVVFIRPHLDHKKKYLAASLVLLLSTVPVCRFKIRQPLELFHTKASKFGGIFLGSERTESPHLRLKNKTIISPLLFGVVLVNVSSVSSLVSMSALF